MPSKPAPTLIGALADHRFIAGPKRDASHHAGPRGRVSAERAPRRDAPAWVEPVADDLLAHRGRALVVVGRRSTGRDCTRSLHAMNEAWARAGRRCELIEPVAHAPPGSGRLAARTGERHAGRPGDSLLMIDSNPVYAAPGPLGFAEALKRVQLQLALSRSAERDERAPRIGPCR